MGIFYVQDDYCGAMCDVRCAVCCCGQKTTKPVLNEWIGADGFSVVLPRIISPSAALGCQTESNRPIFIPISAERRQ